jgi:dethiobiotin synthetase
MGIRYFVTATGTDVGKTYVTTSLIRRALAEGKTVAAYKPIVSGFDAANLAGADVGKLIDALGLEPSDAMVRRLSPWRYAAPLAPSMAARREGHEIDFDKLVTFSRTVAQSDFDIVLIEGIGGVMVPIDATHTVLDWIEHIDMPALLVAGSYLGTISHTLTAFEAMKHRNICVDAIVVSESLGGIVSLQETVEEIGRWTKDVPVMGIPREGDGHELRGLLG